MAQQDIKTSGQQAPGLRRELKARHLTMIAIGGSIGTGLFVASGATVSQAGPGGALLSYALIGLMVYFLMTSLGELAAFMPVSGSFSTYGAKYVEEGFGFALGWNYWYNWAVTIAVDLVASQLVMSYWFPDTPGWIWSALFLGLMFLLNYISVKGFGEAEYWFALIKVVAIALFLIVGVVFLGTGTPVAGHTTGMHLITENGGMFPHGLLPALVLVQGVIFAFAGIELIGTAAGECKDPAKMMPKAINSVIWRIGLFYVGSVVLLVLLLPWNAYQAGQSPFVTFFSKLGVPYIGTIMNIVVLTAALSSLNSGLYSTGRILRSLAMGGSAPKLMAKMSSQQVPYAGILVTCGIYVIGVVLNYLVPSQVFEIVLNIASLGIIASWAFIIVCQMRLRKAVREGRAQPVSFKMPGAPFTSWLTLAFLLIVVVMMAFDYPNGTWTIATIPVLAVLLTLGWFGLRKRAQEVKREQQAHEEQNPH